MLCITGRPPREPGSGPC